MPATGLIYDERYLEHITGEGSMELPADKGLAHQMPHPEAPTRIANVYSLLKRSGFLERLEEIAPCMADRQSIERVHNPQYVDRIANLCRTGGGRIDGWEGGATPVCPQSFDIALLAAGGCIDGVDAILDKRIDNGYALVRPPGHHAERDEGMGFCLFNNIAVTAEYLKHEHHLEKILIVDWDVHHGNGTQSIFYDDPSVLFVSIHQDGNYPENSGLIEEVGSGPGEGFNVNIPLPAGTGDRGYTAAMEDIVTPIGRQFKPDFILVSAGQDPNMVDPLGRMAVTYEGFNAMTQGVKQLARECCHGRLLLLQEGGYNIVYQAYAVVEILEVLSGLDSGLTKPYAGFKYAQSDQYLQTIQAVSAQHRVYWDLG